jgi:2-(1,2-epoxy-1,2-dihydrophenyl)acetyl-CoA isomerase
MAEDFVLTSNQDGVLTITLNRPSSMNGVNHEVGRMFNQAIADAELDPSARVVIVTGAGRAFCAGGDFKNFGVQDPGDSLAMKWQNDRVWNEVEAKTTRFIRGAEGPAMLHTMGKPTIAMIRGPAVGAGIGLAACCDFRIASENATFQSGYIRVGISPDWGTSYYVVKLLGAAKARELYFINRKVEAEEALRIGLVNRVVPDDRLEAETMEFARQLASQPPVALACIKEDINAAEAMNLREVIDIECRNMARTFQTEDAKEAVRAFIEKRPAKFKGY